MHDLPRQDNPYLCSCLGWFPCEPPTQGYGLHLMRFHTPGTFLPFLLQIQQPGLWEHFLLSPTPRSLIL